MGAQALGVQFATPVFDGATEKEIKRQPHRSQAADLGQDQALRRA